jgi:hypothetical protein
VQKREAAWQEIVAGRAGFLDLGLRVRLPKGTIRMAGLLCKDGGGLGKCRPLEGNMSSGASE